MRKISLTILSATFGILVFSSCDKKKETPAETTPTGPTYTPASFTLNWKKAWGTGYEDDFGGGVVDASGNMYFTGATQPDVSYADIFVTKVNLITQTMVWSKSFDSGSGH